MKKLKKILAMALAMAMVLGMSVTTFAATPHAGDKVDVKITGLGKGATVNLYQIAEGVYGTDGNSGGVGFVEYKWYTNGAAPFANLNSPTAAEINSIAKDINANTLKDKDGKDVRLTPVNTTTLQGDATTYTYNASAGAYIAIITAGAGDKSIYNPIYLTASYGKEGQEAGSLYGGTVDANSKYIGTEAVAKKSNPTIDKKVSGEIVMDDDGKKATASVGKVLNFTLDDIEVPSYPANATNKTFFISDTMVTGLTFDYSSLKVLIKGHENDSTYVTRVDSPTEADLKAGDPADKTVKYPKNTVVFKIGETVIAKAVPTTTTGNVAVDSITGEALAGTGFNLSFVYDNLITNQTTGAIMTPIVKYDAVVNSTAVVADASNPNTATLFYAKNPDKGTTWTDLPNKPGPNPDGSNDYESVKDTETIYTYQLAFKKTGEGDDATKLAGAIFGIYTEADCRVSSLIDTVTTDANGFAVSTRVGKGTYFIKELWAPEGYSLNDNIYQMEASWATATTTVNGSVTNREYTTDIDEAARLTSEDAPKQVGWIKDSIFYDMSHYTTETAEEAGAQAAYIKSTSTSNTSSVTTITNEGTGTVTTLKDASGNVINGSAITNTKLTSLPSTGGIGTTIFTIGGCAIMIIAAGLYFASRRKKEV